MSLKRLVFVLLLVAPLVAGLAAPARAQDAAADLVLADLAAMAPDGADLPDSYRLLRERAYTARAYGDEAVFPGAGEELEALGLTGVYQTVYYDTETLVELTFSVNAFEGETDIDEGFDYIYGPGGAEAAAALAGVGEAPRAFTTIDQSIADGIEANVAIAVVTVGPVIIDVSAFTTGPSGIGEDLVIETMTAFAGRVESVLDGDRPAALDPELPAVTLTSDELAPYQEGYLAAEDVQVAALGIDAADYLGGYSRSFDLTYPGFDRDDLGPAISGLTGPGGVLFVTATVLAFDTEAAAAAAQYRFDDLRIPSALPAFPDSFRMQGDAADLEGVDEDIVAGIDRSGASQVAILPGGPIDSVRFGVQVGERVVVVEVAGATTLALAREAARPILVDQVACVIDGDCEPSADIVAAADIALAAGETDFPSDRWPSALDAEREVFDSVWRTIRDRYAYRTGTQNVLLANYKVVDWAAVRAEYEPRAIAAAEAGETTEFYTVLAEMIGELDDQHAAYQDPDRASISLADPSQVVYAGVGVVMARGLDANDPGLVLYVYPGSPAAEAGIERRDRIVALDGEPLETGNREQFNAIHQQFLRRDAPDEPLDPVTLTVEEPGRRRARTIEVERVVADSRHGPDVRRLDFAPEVGYIQITDFGDLDLVGQFEAGLEGLLDGDVPLEGLVIDVRGNPGGAVIAFTLMLGHFVEGEVGRYHLRDGTLGRPLVVEASALKERLDGIPVAVLSDDRMYSASEMTAAVLQSQDRATVIGVRSPGDFEIVQGMLQPDSSALNVPFGIFTTPGDIYEGRGVIPDIEVNEDWTRFPEDEDPHLAALDLFGVEPS